MGKKKDKKDKKKKDKKTKKEKKEKKKKESKKKKKQASSSSSSESDSGSSSSSGEAKQKKQKKSKKEGKEEGDVMFPMPVGTRKELLPPEDGIQRFEYAADETGPLGVRFSGGFPPLILAVLPDSHAQRKGIPVNFEVHAINGNPLITRNIEVVMAGLKARPVILDVRPQGWKPKEIAKELAQKKMREENEMRILMDLEMSRRDQAAQDKEEQKMHDAVREAERKEQERIDNEKLLKRAREQAAVKRGKEEEWEKVLTQDAPNLRKAAADIMAAPYGTAIVIEGQEGSRLPLHLLTRRKEVAWFWAGEIQELIGGGMFDPKDSWLEN